MAELIIAARQGDLGHGLTVQRILPYRKRRMVGPFIFLDHAGPVTLPAGIAREADVRPHPHIGLSTVSYLFSGRITHRDSLGVEQIIRPGEVNWMTAGRGISHSERFEDPSAFTEPGLELLQSWVALPAEDEECAPAFEHYDASALAEAEDDGVWMRVVAGSAYGLTSRVATRSPLFYVHAVMKPGSRMSLPTGHAERGVYVAHGSIEADGAIVPAGSMAVFGAGEFPTIVSHTGATLMLLGGEPLGERHIWWNFVSSRKERIEAAKADWTAGRIALPPHDHDEWIPLPGDSADPPKPQPLS